MKPAVLVVDDNHEMLEVIADELGETCQVLTAPNGQMALQVLQQENIDLVVSDIMMPVLDGFALCKYIKSNFEFSHIPVILLTAKNTMQSRITGLEYGADAYIEKPFDPEHLQVQISNLITNRNKLRQYFANSPSMPLPGMAQSHAEEGFLDHLNQAIEENIDDQDLDVEKLARIVGMSRTSLFRKIKSATSLTPNELINVTRLKKAAAMLLTEQYKIYEVSDRVGYASQTNFGRNFFKQFGMTPSEYQKTRGTGKHT